MGSLWHIFMLAGVDVDTTISFEPPLPCRTTNGDSYCGKPATVGIAYDGPGGFRLMPVCRDCTLAVAKLYKVVSLADELKPEKE
jgi:hypothetical protein